MKSIIKEIFHCNRGNNQTVKPSKEYFEAVGRVADLIDEFKRKLPSELKTPFEEICKLNLEVEARAVDDNFTEGVKLGILIGVESCN